MVGICGGVEDKDEDAMIERLFECLSRYGKQPCSVTHFADQADTKRKYKNTSIDEYGSYIWYYIA